MGVLANPDHERCCQIAHKRIWSGEQRTTALLAAYVETIYDGLEPDSNATQANSRKFFNRPDAKKRMAELAEYAAKLAGIDAGWAQLKLRAMVEANIDDFLSPADAEGHRYLTLRDVPRENLLHVVELNQEETSEKIGRESVRDIRRVKIKLPDKIAALGLMAKIAGWLAPERRELSGQMTLESLVAASLKPKQDAA